MTKKTKSNKEIYFDKEEKDFADYVENTNLTSLARDEKKEMVDMLSSAAKHTLSKSKTVSLRLSERDLFKIKAKVASEGMPYQTLIASILHKHIATT